MPHYNILGRPTFDAQDAAILAARIALWNAVKGPRVGDFIRMADRTLRRFTHNWDEHGLQVTCTQYGGSFYFGGPWCSYSGALDPIVPLDRIVDTGQKREGPVWFFHHDYQRAHNGVDAHIPCRVYRELVVS